jgi:hypothetical protein
MNQNQKSTGKGYSEAIQDKEKKLVASMKWLDMHFYIVCISLALFPSHSLFLHVIGFYILLLMQ